MPKLPKVQKWFRKFGKLFPSMSALHEQQIVFVCSHILKLNEAECVNILPQKTGLRLKPVPGRGCPSLKLRLSRDKQRLATIADNPTDPFATFELQYPSHNVPEQHKIYWSPGSKIRKGPVGNTESQMKKQIICRTIGSYMWCTDCDRNVSLTCVVRLVKLLLMGHFINGLCYEVLPSSSSIFYSMKSLLTCLYLPHVS